MNLLDTEIMLLEALIGINLILLVVALIDLAKRNLKTMDKLTWLTAICIFPLLGILCYYLFVVKKKKGVTPP